MIIYSANSANNSNLTAIKLDIILTAIKTGKYKAVIEKIRKEPDKKKRTKLKKNGLPYFVVSKFKDNYRDTDHFESSKHLILDIDDIKNAKKEKRRIESDNRVLFAFISPSGNGIKVGFKLDKIVKSATGYKAFYNDFRKHFGKQYNLATDTVSDPTRACFVSYDPTLYHNKKAKEVKFYIPETKLLPKSNFPIPNSDYKYLPDAVKMLQGSLNNYNDWLKVGMALASMGEQGREYWHIVSQNPNFQDTTTELDAKFDNFLKTKNGNITLGTLFYYAKQYGFEFPDKKTVEICDEKTGEVREVTKFWYFTSNQIPKLKISYSGLLDFFKEHGFYRYEFQENQFLYVRVSNNIVSEISTVKLKDFLSDYIKKLPKWIEKEPNPLSKGQLLESILSQAKALFHNAILEFIPYKKLQFKRSEKNKAFFFYKNTAVRVTDKEIKTVSYANIKGHIWKNHIIDRNFSLSSDNISEFEQFITNVTGDDRARKKALMTAIGGLLHSYKDRSSNRCKVPIFMDEKFVPGGDPIGGTGKTIICDAIAKIKNVAVINGKAIDFSRPFIFSNITLDTEVIFIDDVRKNFDFEALFHFITGDFPVEKKHANIIIILFVDSPKLAIATNFVIKGDSYSYTRRQHLNELADYYHKGWTPEDEFKHRLFDDWDTVEWNKFDTFMMKCVELYNYWDFADYKKVNLEKNKILVATCNEFVNFMETGQDAINGTGIILFNQEISKKDLYQQFINTCENPYYKKKLSQRKFTSWLKKYTIYKKWNIEEYRSNGIDFIVILNEKTRE